MKCILVELLRRPVAYHPILADITGSVTSAVFLSQALYWTDRGILANQGFDGWFWKTSKQWHEETRLSRREQEGARKRCVDLKILKEELRGNPAKLHFFIDLEVIESLIARTIKNVRLVHGQNGGLVHPPCTETPNSIKEEETIEEETTEPRERAFDPGEVFRQAKRLYRRQVGKSIGSLGPKAREWAGLVNKHGADVVLAAVEMWATELGQNGRNLRWPLAVFMKQSEEFLEAVTTKSEKTDEMPYLQPRP